MYILSNIFDIYGKYTDRDVVIFIDVVVSFTDWGQFGILKRAGEHTLLYGHIS